MSQATSLRCSLAFMLNSNMISKEVLGLLTNDLFIREMCENPHPDQIKWHIFEDAMPYSVSDFDEAKRIFQHLDDLPEFLSSDEIEELRARIGDAL